MDEKNRDIYLELLTDLKDRCDRTHDCVISLDKKQDLFMQKMDYEIGEIKTLDAAQNSILEEHHKRSVALQNDNVLREQALRLEILKMDKRLDSLEAPRKTLKQLKRWVLWLGGVAGALVAILKFLEYF